MIALRAFAVAACLLGLSSLVGCSGGVVTQTPESDSGASQDTGAAADALIDAPCTPTVDDAGVTHSCGSGGHGPGDRDDGGGNTPPPPDASADASNLPFGSSCLDNSQCESGICFLYKAKGQFCTLKCAGPSDCPAPSLGCNGMGYCRMGN